MPAAEQLTDPAGADRSATVGRWLRDRLADSLQVDPDRIHAAAPLTSYGLDSMLSAMLLTEIEDTVGVLVDPAALPPGMSLDDLTRIVLDLERGEPTGGPPLTHIRTDAACNADTVADADRGTTPSVHPTPSPQE